MGPHIVSSVLIRCLKFPRPFVFVSYKPICTIMYIGKDYGHIHLPRYTTVHIFTKHDIFPIFSRDTFPTLTSSQAPKPRSTPVTGLHRQSRQALLQASRASRGVSRRLKGTSQRRQVRGNGVGNLGPLKNCAENDGFFWGGVEVPR